MNPSSRSGRGRRLWEYWKLGLSQAGVEYEIDETRGPGDGRILAEKTTGNCVVVAVGGDGTINEVLDGVVRSGNPGLRMGVLYAGTSPDFCRFHKIPIEPSEALDTLLNGRTVRVDVGSIEYRDGQDRICLAHFGCSCNIGMGAAVARGANNIRSYLGDVLGTAMSVIGTLLTYRPYDLRLLVDGKPVMMEKINNLSVIKNPYIASGLKVGLDVGPSDGALWLLGMRGKGILEMVGLLPRYYTGTIIRHPDVVLRRCNTIEMNAEGAREVEFDGDPRGYLPARITLKPGALPLLVGKHE